MSANDPIRTSATPDFCNGRALRIGVHLGGDFGHAFLRAGFVSIAAWCSADAKPSYDLIAALNRDPARKGYNIGKAEKRRASACRIFTDGLDIGARICASPGYCEDAPKVLLLLDCCHRLIVGTAWKASLPAILGKTRRTE